MKNRLLILLSFIYSLYCFPLYSQFRNSRGFENIDKGGVLVNCFFQDEFERIWAGTSEGMFLYNGDNLEKHLPHFEKGHHNVTVYSSLKVDDEHYYIGTGAGLYLLDMRANAYAFIYETGSIDIRSMARIDDDRLLLGTMNGLVVFNIRTNHTRRVEDTQQQPVYSLLGVDSSVLYASSNGGFYVYDGKKDTCTFISLPEGKIQSHFIISMALDKKRNSIWMGTESDLLKYDLANHSFECKPSLTNNSFKVILVDSRGEVWLGTDNGLYIYNEETDAQEYYVHSSLDSRSLSNNVVWGLYEGSNGDIWIGTDCGISLYRSKGNFYVQRWEKIVRSEEGNRITAIYRDGRGNFWLGGTNGLVRYDIDKEVSEWYKMKESRHFISHNRIRHIYEDSDHNLWVATDGGVNLFDYERNDFVNFAIMDSTRTRNANWCYSIFEDAEKRLWISAYRGGIFVVDKRKLLSQKSSVYLAEQNYYASAGKFGLLSGRIHQAIPDKEGNVWVSASIDGLNKIIASGEGVEYFAPSQSEKRLSTLDIVDLICDSEGYIWVAGIGTLDRINPSMNAVTSIKNELLVGKSIQSIIEKDNNLWLILSDGILVMDKHTYDMRYLKLDEARYSCAFFDPETQFIWVGGIDQILHFSPDSLLMPSPVKRAVILSSILINDKYVQTGVAYDNNVILKEAPAYTREIVLEPWQNNLSVEFAGASLSEGTKPRYRYRLVDADKDWRLLEANTNRILYSNLRPGDYILQIEQTDSEGLTEYPMYELSISVLHPWYSCIWAKLIYALLIVGLLLWIVNYVRVRNRLRIEHIEKEKAVELSNLKMDFLTDMSHELKTPLSLILEPANRLMATTKNTQTKAMLQTVHKNATRLSTLVHQIIDFRDIGPEKVELALSQLEIVEFVHSIIAVYQENADTKSVTIELITNLKELYMEVDPLKLESIINNLLSNALKFTSSGGKITVMLDELHTDNDASRLKIEVSDTGMGIEKDDLPYIFDRFYQSKHNQEVNKEGSGIGLSMVRNYVIQHGGEIEVASEIGVGTTFTIILPVIRTQERADSISTEYIQDEGLQQLRILIVEDNVEIARFMADNLKGMHCEIAHNGKSGLEAAQQFMPDIIVADIMMPIMDGVEMSRLLKRNLTTATIPIILLTAKDNKKTELDAYKLGVDAFLSKPFEMDHLVARILQIVKNKSLLVRRAQQADKEELPVQTTEVTESVDEKFLTDITRLIEEHLEDPELNVQKLAELSGLNSKQVYRKLKLLTGNTAVDYIKSIRLKKAAMLLSQKKFTVAEVMYMVGFSTHSYFAKCFMDKYGKTPKVYMDEYMG